ncbi:hypothetical protein RRG08_047578 [Elysia crispata]|uniref:Uncharacterized protein n=1 Tax=Elysia crispata TaxID=231223 RepID=A0AAE1E3X3_9GAST|nr:hypothetical protein RRG08_047578 [Elysia crispata]
MSQQAGPSEKESDLPETVELVVVLGMLVVLDIGVPTAWQVLDPLQRWLKTFCHIQRSNTGGDSVLRHQLELFLKENNTVWLSMWCGRN